MPAQTAGSLNAKARNREENPPGWMGRHSWRHKGYLQIAGAMLPPAGCGDSAKRERDLGEGEEINLSKATFFSLFGNNQIMPSFQISWFSCAFVFFEGRYNHAGLCGYV